VEQLRLQVDEAAAILSRKKISLAGAIYLSNVVVMPSAVYRLKFSTATTLQIDRIQIPLRKVIAKMVHITAAHTTVLLSSVVDTWDAGGRGGVVKLPVIERLRILQLACQEHDTVFGKVMRGAVWQMQIDSGSSDLRPIVLESRYSGEGRPAVEDTWLGMLWQWMSSNANPVERKGSQCTLQGHPM
jgi:hypothetical protein